MNRAVLFRFHKNAAVCQERIAQLRALNPGISIFGIYGGEPELMNPIKNILQPLLDDFYVIVKKNAQWKWLHSDLVVRQWYLDRGNKFDFEILHLLEWDLILFESLEKLYDKVSHTSLGITALTPLEKLKEWYWLRVEPYKKQWNQLQQMIADRYSYYGPFYGSLGPGTCFPREFLAKYSTIDVHELSNDEIRVPLYGLVLGFELQNNGLYQGAVDLDDPQFFNCLDYPISRETIMKEQLKIDGRRAFHPFRNHYFR